MRVAICFSGHVRNFDLRYMQQFIEYNNEHTFDWFFSVWDTIDAQNSWRNVWSQTRPLDIELIKQMNPVRYEVENYDSLKDNFKLRNFHPTLMPEPPYRLWEEGVLHSTPMMYKMYKANLLKQQYEIENNFKYDVVMRCRANVYFRDSNIKLDPVKENVLYNHGGENGRAGVGSFRPNGSAMLNDLFYYGSSETMDIVCDVYNHLSMIMHKYGNSAPEYIFHDWVVRESNVTIENHILDVYYA